MKNEKTIFSFARSLSLSQRYLVVVFIIVILSNLPALYFELRRIYGISENVPHQMVGYQFDGLQPLLKDVPIMGYYSDRDIKTDAKAAKLFAHAQFVLAPTILDLGRLEHRYILIVCENEDNAWRIMDEIDAMALRRNKMGHILAERKR